MFASWNGAEATVEGRWRQRDMVVILRYNSVFPESLGSCGRKNGGTSGRSLGGNVWTDGLEKSNDGRRSQRGGRLTEVTPSPSTLSALAIFKDLGRDRTIQMLGT